MEADVQALIAQIHDSGTMAVIAIAGGGSRALAWLQAVPGCSRTLIEGTIPYSRAAMIAFLGAEPENYASAGTARALAEVAWQRARDLHPEGRVIGLSCAATLITDRPKRGDHRAHIGICDGTHTRAMSLTFQKGARARSGEEEIASRLLINVFAEACGLPRRLETVLLPGEAVIESAPPEDDPVRKVAAGEIPLAIVQPDGDVITEAPRGAAVLSGSFNPLHAGHKHLAEAARRKLGAEVIYEISVTNVDKPALQASTLRKRLVQFRGWARVALARARLFSKKAALFPEATFVLGYDTASRLLVPRYYEGGEEGMRAAFDAIRAAGCRFLVAGRVVEDGGFHTLDDLDVPPEYADLFMKLGEDEFRRDISSSEIRRTLA
jgi:hypothetical protein